MQTSKSNLSALDMGNTHTQVSARSFLSRKLDKFSHHDCEPTETDTDWDETGHSYAAGLIRAVESPLRAPLMSVEEIVERLQRLNRQPSSFKLPDWERNHMSLEDLTDILSHINISEDGDSPIQYDLIYQVAYETGETSFAEEQVDPRLALSTSADYTEETVVTPCASIQEPLQDDDEDFSISLGQLQADARDARSVGTGYTLEAVTQSCTSSVTFWEHEDEVSLSLDELELELDMPGTESDDLLYWDCSATAPPSGSADL